MKNQAFNQKSATEKRRRLAAVLRSAGGGLDGGMVSRILPNVYIHRQYKVSIFTDSRRFREAVARALAGDAALSAAFSQARRGQAAAVIAPPGPAGSKKGRRAIYIYAPGICARKGAKK